VTRTYATHVLVKTQEELHAALAKYDGGKARVVECVGDATFTVTDSASVRAYDSATVVASGSATVRASGSATVVASDSATVRASGSATVWAHDSASVWAYGSATVRAHDSATVWAHNLAAVWAHDSASVWAYGLATVVAARFVAVTIGPTRYGTPTVTGGVQIVIPAHMTAQEWCEYHGVEVADGVATLYKAVDDDYSTDNARRAGITYTPGTQPSAPDWDGGKAECGAGLHFCPTPWHARRFNEQAKRYVACPVRVDEIVTHKHPEHPTKIKAPRVCGPIVEVDIDGNPVGVAA